MDIFAETGTKEKKQSKKELMQLLEEKDKQINDYINDLKRLQAEFENYIKRNEKEKEEFSKYASYKLMIKLLNIADDFDRAMHNIKKSQSVSDDLVNGIEIIHKNFHKLLQEENVKEIKSVKEKFNPDYHEVIKKIKSENDDDIILEEIQKGYTLHGKVLRPAKVIVSEKIKEESNHKEEIKNG